MQPLDHLEATVCFTAGVTLIFDLARRRVIELLDREPATFEAWLRRNPQVEAVAWAGTADMAGCGAGLSRRHPGH